MLEGQCFLSVPLDFDLGGTAGCDDGFGGREGCKGLGGREGEESEPIPEVDSDILGLGVGRGLVSGPSVDSPVSRD